MTASPPYDTISMTSRSLPIFTKCCCCIPIRIGCFILGYLTLIFNTFHTLALLTFTTYIGISTHGFDHFDTDHPREVSTNQTLPTVESIEKPFLNEIGILLMVVLCANVAWLIVNVACLVGLHKKRPGPIRVYVMFAAARLLLSMAGFVYILMTANPNTQSIFTHCADLGLAAYFVLVYYIYAMQLEREQAQEMSDQSSIKENISVIYPINIEKQKIVDV